jgi:hypothetical protein
MQQFEPFSPHLRRRPEVMKLASLNQYWLAIVPELVGANLKIAHGVFPLRSLKKAQWV